MKQFLKDYNEMVIKSQLGFMKIHWKGLTGFLVVYGLIIYGMTKLSVRKLEKRLYDIDTKDE